MELGLISLQSQYPPADSFLSLSLLQLGLNLANTSPFLYGALDFGWAMDSGKLEMKAGREGLGTTLAYS